MLSYSATAKNALVFGQYNGFLRLGAQKTYIIRGYTGMEKNREKHNVMQHLLHAHLSITYFSFHSRISY